MVSDFRMKARVRLKPFHKDAPSSIPRWCIFNNYSTSYHIQKARWSNYLIKNNQEMLLELAGFALQEQLEGNGRNSWVYGKWLICHGRR